MSKAPFLDKPTVREDLITVTIEDRREFIIAAAKIVAKKSLDERNALPDTDDIADIANLALVMVHSCKRFNDFLV